MKPLIDNDVIVKLAHLNLVAEGLEVLDGTSARDAKVLSTSQFSLFVRKDRPRGVAKFGADVHDRISDFVSQADKLNLSSGTSHHAALVGVPGIDAGEAILIAEAAAIPNTLLVTGDKRSLRALAAAAGCANVADALQGRVVSFDQVMLRILEAYGYAATYANVMAGVACNGGLEAAYKSGNEPATISRLADYVADLRGKTGALLRSR